MSEPFGMRAWIGGRTARRASRRSGLIAPESAPCQVWRVDSIRGRKDPIRLPLTLGYVVRNGRVAVGTQPHLGGPILLGRLNEHDAGSISTNSMSSTHGHRHGHQIRNRRTRLDSLHDKTKGVVHVPPGQIRVDVLSRLALQRRVAVEVPQHGFGSEHALEDRAGELVGEDVLVGELAQVRTEAFGHCGAA
jgi:hypothetical protein